MHRYRPFDDSQHGRHRLVKAIPQNGRFKHIARHHSAPVTGALYHASSSLGTPRYFFTLLVKRK